MKGELKLKEEELQAEIDRSKRRDEIQKGVIRGQETSIKSLEEMARILENSKHDKSRDLNLLKDKIYNIESEIKFLKEESEVILLKIYLKEIFVLSKFYGKYC